MKQIVQPVSGGPVELLDVPRPVPEPTEVLVRTVCVGDLARAPSARSPRWPSPACWPRRGPGPTWSARWCSKARDRGDRRHPAGGARPAGPGRAARLLGRRAWCSRSATRSAGSGPASWSPPAGRARRTTRSSRRCPGCCARRCRTAVSRPGRRVHHDRRRSRCTGCGSPTSGPGSKVVVVGLGLIGQLAARLAMAAGCDVAGHRPGRLPARRSRPGPACSRSTSAARRPPSRCSPGPGAAARTRCWSARRARRRPPVMRVPALCRDRAAVVIVGRRRAPARPDPVLRARAVAAVRPLLRARPVRPVLRGVGRRLPGRARCAGPRAATSRPSSTCSRPAGSPSPTW